MGQKKDNKVRLKVAIIGSGNIGTDLLVKIMRSPVLECSYFIGRRLDSEGIKKAQALGVRISDKGIEAITQEPDCCDIVIDATSAKDHLIHWPILEKLGKAAIDMTPSKIGRMIVPAINAGEVNKYRNINMISCGGQSSLPLIYAITRIAQKPEYIEVVSSISSNSAGPATRRNIDEYIENTENAVRYFSGTKKAKVILVLNPAQPCIDMQTSISVKVARPDMEKICQAVKEMEFEIARYVPGYQVVVSPIYENNRIFVMVRVRGLGDYLPSYAGNLDIINCAAIEAAEVYANARNTKKVK